GEERRGLWPDARGVGRALRAVSHTALLRPVHGARRAGAHHRLLPRSAGIRRCLLGSNLGQARLGRGAYALRTAAARRRAAAYVRSLCVRARRLATAAGVCDPRRKSAARSAGGGYLGGG